MTAVASGKRGQPASTPAISVLMSVYNGERFLADAVDSILGQSVGDFEFLIVDDGSTDGTAAILRGYDDPRIRLITNPRNLGLTRSLNIGLAAARGRFIARMDADDIAVPDRFARQLAFFEANPRVVLVGSGHARLDDDARTLAWATRALRPVEVRWLSFFWSPLLHPSAMFRAGAIHRAGLRYDERLATSQDYDLWTRMLGHGDGAVLEGPLVLWRRHGAAVGVTRRADQIAGHKRIAAAHLRRRFPDLAPRLDAFERLVELHLQPARSPLPWREVVDLLDVADLLLDRLLTGDGAPADRAARTALLNRARVTLVSLVLRNGRLSRRPFLVLRFLLRIRRLLWPSVVAGIRDSRSRHGGRDARRWPARAAGLPTRR